MLFLFVLSIYFPELNLEETLSYIWDEYDQSQGVHQHTVGHHIQQLHLIGLAHFLYLCRNRYALKAKSYFIINFVLNSSFDLKKTCEIWSNIKEDMTFGNIIWGRLRFASAPVYLIFFWSVQSKSVRIYANQWCFICSCIQAITVYSDCHSVQNVQNPTWYIWKKLKISAIKKN